MCHTIHCKEPIPKILKKIFPEKELRGHSPNFHIHVSMNNLYIPTISLPLLLQENMWTDPGRVAAGQWIRIRIRNSDPDPGGQNDPKK
jgi:hypothetical protein